MSLIAVYLILQTFAMARPPHYVPFAKGKVPHPGPKGNGLSAPWPAIGISILGVILFLPKRLSPQQEEIPRTWLFNS